ncbi:MAG: hypothetical protein KF847_18395 [Pirellulales bacterium]|nr:hypothetical protein [Pirellulales bacterium]
MDSPTPAMPLETRPAAGRSAIRGNALGEGSSRYADWLLTLLRWDGLLPAFMAATPRVAKLLCDGWPLVQVLVGVFLPIGVFFVRAGHGAMQLRDGRHAPWQAAAFYLALLILLLFDALVAIFIMIPGGITRRDWQIAGTMFGAYFVLAAAAFFPLRPAPLIPATSAAQD